jgi:streptogrisin D
VVETGGHAAEAVAHAVNGEWDKAADSALDMSVSALETAANAATDGIFGKAEEAVDGVAKAVGLPSVHEGAHDLLSSATHAVGDALGDGLSALVGTDQSVQSLHSFDDGDILGGIGHMAQGAADTIGSAIGQGLSDIGSGIGDLLGGGSDGGSAAQGGSDGGGGAAPGGSDGGQAAVDSSSYDALSSGQAPDDGGNISVSDGS